jgi:hypothetical protein
MQVIRGSGSCSTLAASMSVLKPAALMLDSSMPERSTLAPATVSPMPESSMLASVRCPVRACPCPASLPSASGPSAAARARSSLMPGPPPCRTRCSRIGPRWLRAGAPPGPIAWPIAWPRFPAGGDVTQALGSTISVLHNLRTSDRGRDPPRRKAPQRASTMRVPHAASPPASFDSASHPGGGATNRPSVAPTSARPPCAATKTLPRSPVGPNVPSTPFPFSALFDLFFSTPS